MTATSQDGNGEAPLSVRVPIAFDARGQEVRPAEHAEGPFRCGDCQTVVSQRRAHERRGHQVRAHFAHHPNVQCGFSEGEGEAHLQAKRRVVAAVSERIPIAFVRHCPSCDGKQRHRMPENVVKATIEYRLPSGRRADVALQNGVGDVLAVIEVLESHEVDQEKKIDLAETRWCEIRAATILGGDEWALVQDHLVPFTCRACRFKEVRPWHGDVRRHVGCPLPDAGIVVAVETCSTCRYFVTATPEGIQCWGAHSQ